MNKQNGNTHTIQIWLQIYNLPPSCMRVCVGQTDPIFLIKQPEVKFDEE